MKYVPTLGFLLVLLMLPLTLASQSAAELNSRLNKSSTSKSEKLDICFKLGAIYATRSPQTSADYYHRASLLASELGEKSREAEAIYLSAEGLMRKRDYSAAAARFNQAWNTSRNYGLRETALSSMDRLEEMASKQNDLKEALKWSREKVAYLRENSGRSTSSGDAMQKLESQISVLQSEKKLLLDKLAEISGQSENLGNTYKETEAQLQEIREKASAEISAKEEVITQITRDKQRIDSISQNRNRLVSKLTKEQLADSMIKAQQDRLIQEQKRQVAEAELGKQQSEALRNILALVSCFVLLLAFLFYIRFRAKKRTANQLEKKNAIIEEEQKKIDGLLLNILPPAIAQELKTHNKVAAQRYEQATVMFIDFTGFTNVAEKLSPEDLVQELDFCFSNFDRIISQYNIEKIKTVGDAYICASGLSDKNSSPSDIVRAALEIQDFLQHVRATRMNQALPFFEARIGIHTGPVVAGVVGKKKFAYDIWGDTVNIAARMEESCEPGRVNVSENAYWLAKYEFDWLSRGKIAAKNKGMMDMYYVQGIKSI
ncbi:MAG: hypothetical protein IPL65_00275 [Lewinellaceae bacterium]|nr:hypothetical protein [Lewinellaceae bacterium]